MKLPKILFFDIDGTLVSFKTHRVPQSAIDAIKKMREKGLKVWIATGRPLPFINNLADLEYDGIMSVNGGCCCLSDGTVIFSKPVDKADVERMRAEQAKTGMAVVYAGNTGAKLLAPKGIPQAVEEVFELLDIQRPTLYDIDEELGFEVMQVIAFFKEEESSYVMSEILQQCNETRWHPEFADCVAKNTDKATGIDEVIRYYGIDISETMAFGDGGNDITMLRHAGVGVAMGNANDSVKAAADVVTLSVDEDGVARVLSQFL